MPTVTAEVQQRLLAVPCPWCEAGTKVFCRPPRTARRRGWTGSPEVLTNLPGASHDARWRAAGLVAVSC